VLAKVLGRQTERTVELLSLNPEYGPRELPRSELAWMARILWASQ
jgi:phage repressor protein C with HTH and peptisase S24 domain